MNCKNCHEPLAFDAKYCKHCGARVVNQELSFGYLIGEMSERFFNVENNLILRTLKDMFLRPQEVIHDYIHGTRKKHLNVANYLALAITFSGLQIFLMQKFFMTNMDPTWFSPNNPLDEKGFTDAIWEYQSLFYILLIPVYAVFAKITFFNYKKYTYLHHIVVVTYTQAHLSIALFLPIMFMLVLGANFYKVVFFFSFPFMIMYTAYCYKKLYQISLGKIIGKTLLFLVVAGTLYIGFSILMWVVLILTGVVTLEDLRAMQEAQALIEQMAQWPTDILV